MAKILVLAEPETVAPSSGVGLGTKAWVLEEGTRVNVGHGEYTAAQARKLARNILACADAAEAHEMGQKEGQQQMRRLVLHLTVEAKDEGSEPTNEEVASRLTDVLNDVTKHDEMIGWRVYGQVSVVGEVQP